MKLGLGEKLFIDETLRSEVHEKNDKGEKSVDFQTFARSFRFSLMRLGLGEKLLDEKLRYELHGKNDKGEKSLNFCLQVSGRFSWVMRGEAW